MFHIKRGVITVGLADDHGGYAGDGDVGWYVFHDDAAGTDLGAFADLNITDNRCVSADQDATTNFRLSLCLSRRA